jgi:hypothetical protein
MGYNVFPELCDFTEDQFVEVLIPWIGRDVSLDTCKGEKKGTVIGYSINEHGSECVVVRLENTYECLLMHYSKIKDLYQWFRADAEKRIFLTNSFDLLDKGDEKEQKELEQDIKDQHQVEDDACEYCGCMESRIEGDDVYFGYTGWPCCPDCKGV